MTRLICLDVDGTISDRFLAPTAPGIVDALGELRRRYPVRLVTNATSLSHGRLAGMLAAQGLLDDPAELITPAISARSVLRSRDQASGILLAESSAREDFGWFREDPAGRAVVVATEAHDLTIAELQPAFRLLLEGAAFYTLQRNRYFRQGEQLVTDLGPVEAFLGYAADRKAENLGKPSPLLFEALATAAGCALDQVVMAGDDAEFDASGSVALGMQGILVRTGKYRPGDEERFDPAPTAVLDSVAELPGWLVTSLP
jgi:HAD superfamily hydrolase (TIGR01458 family)